MKKLLLLFAFLIPLFAFGQQVTQQSKTPASGSSAGNQYFGWYGGIFNGYIIFPIGSNAVINRQTGIEGQVYLQTSDSTLQVFHSGHFIPFGGKGGSGSNLYLNGRQFKNNGATPTTPVSLQTDTQKTTPIYYLGFDPATKALRYDTTQFGRGGGSIIPMNGLKKYSGDSVGWGNGINRITKIPMPKSNSIYLLIGDTSKGNGLTIAHYNDGQYGQLSGGDTTGSIYGNVEIFDGNGIIELDANNGSVGRQLIIDPTPITGKMTITDSENLGLQNSADYSANLFTDSLGLAQVNMLGLTPTILTGMVTTITGATTAQTSAGTYRFKNLTYSLGITNSTIPAQDATQSRYTLLYIHFPGTISVSNGALSLNDPIQPTLADGDVEVAMILITPTAVTPGGGGKKTVGTVTQVSVVNANGISGSVANSTTTPAITLSLNTIKPNVVAQTPAGTGGVDSVMVKHGGLMKAISPTYYGAGGGTVTSVAAGTGMNFTTITTSGSVKADTTILQTVANFFPKGDTRYLKSSVVSGLANPTATIGFTAVNGSFTSGIRSDGAPKADSTVIRSVANSYSLAGMQTKLNNYVLASALLNHVAGYGLSGSNYNTSVSQTWTADTTSSGGLVSKSRLATNLGGYVKNPMTTTGDIIYSSSGSTPARLAIGGANTVLHGGTTPSYSNIVNGDIANSTIDLTTKVTGLLPIANGGTGTASPALVAGSNITITGSWPNQTINAPSGAVSSVSNSDGSLTISPTTGAIVASINPANANVYTTNQFVNYAGAGTTVNNGWVLENTTATNAGTTVQVAPGLTWIGHLWNTTPTAADNYAQFQIYPQLFSAAGGNMTVHFRQSIASGSTPSYGDLMSLSTNNGAVMGGALDVEGLLVVKSTTNSYGQIKAGNTTNTAQGKFVLEGSASGDISITGQTNTGTYNFVMPTTAGSANQVLTSQGGGTTSMTWSSVPIVQATADLTGQTSTGNITTFTVGASTATFDISAYLNVTAISTDVIQIQVTYTDENNTSQTVSYTTLNSISDSNYNPVTIRAKNGTVITVKTNLTVGAGSVTFDAGARITQL